MTPALASKVCRDQSETIADAIMEAVNDIERHRAELIRLRGAYFRGVPSREKEPDRYKDWLRLDGSIKTLDNTRHDLVHELVPEDSAIGSLGDAISDMGG